MGASGWSHVTKYEKDVNLAFDAVRKEYFQSGEWREMWEWAVKALKVPQGEVAGLDPANQPSWQEGSTLLQDLCEESGTHSILDMLEVGKEEGFGVLRLLTKEELLEQYKTETPSLEDIENPKGDVLAYERWEGIVHKVYDAKGTPTHWYFEGCSGD